MECIVSGYRSFFAGSYDMHSTPSSQAESFLSALESLSHCFVHPGSFFRYPIELFLLLVWLGRIKGFEYRVSPQASIESIRSTREGAVMVFAFFPSG
jgi:hypothetical protein